jgi:glycogen debranching enzyme
MPSEIKVAPPGITISQGRTFMVTDECGEITPDCDEGVFAIDTRFISGYHVSLNGQPWTLLTSSQISFYAARICLTNQALQVEEADVPANTLGLTIDRTIGEGIHEDFTLTNYSGKPVRLVLELTLQADFADIFEVKARRFVQRGRLHRHWDAEQRALHIRYTHDDFHRAMVYQIPACGDIHSVGFADDRIYWDIELEPGQEWQTCGEIILEHGQHIQRSVYGHPALPAPVAPQGDVTVPGYEPRSDFDERQARWQAHCTAVETPNDHVYRMYRQAVEDMGALRIYDLDVSDEAWVPAAGVPWFVTLFGRDSLLVSLQNMSVAPGFARGALQRLAEYQAQERDDWRDAQPGKILHEVRFGELAHFRTIPFTPYYGTADATILYPIVLSEAYRWTGESRLIREHLAAAEACLRWIDESGDLDGDGFQEYRTYSTQGYANQCWKDSWDAVVYADGSQVQQPKGTCELQGYVYDAKLRMAELYAVVGNAHRAEELRKQAQTLRQRFNETFWLEDEGCFAYGLDAEKRQITSIVSNAGHPLWSGIADPDKAQRTARRLLQPDMWSGWGVRTLSSRNPAYNPYSYHVGSVWPHDNAILAAGMKRYSLFNEANHVIRGIFDAARAFDMYRLPELFAGLERRGRKSDFPVLYPGGANIPQAWASGSIFHMVQTILGLRADAPNRRLYVAPTLPPWLPLITLHQLRVGPTRLDLRFWREGDRSRWEVLWLAADTARGPQDAITVLDDPECALP